MYLYNKTNLQFIWRLNYFFFLFVHDEKFDFEVLLDLPKVVEFFTTV